MSSCCHETYSKQQVVTLWLELEEKSSKLLWFILWGTWMIVQHFRGNPADRYSISVCTKVVEWPNHIAIPKISQWHKNPIIYHCQGHLYVCLPVCCCLLVFLVLKLFPSPACVRQSVTSKRPKKQPLIRLSRHPALPSACFLWTVGHWVVCMQSDSRTSRPPGILLPPTVCVFARDSICHVTAACPSVRAQQPADHHQRLLLLVPWCRWVAMKSLLTLSPRKLIKNQSSGVYFVMLSTAV